MINERGASSLVFLNGWGLSVAEARSSLARMGYGAGVPVVQPTSSWMEEVEQAEARRLVAYSTGAFLALTEPQVYAGFEKIVLLAPFFDFKAESELGGRTRRAQLAYLLRWLRSKPLDAVNDFRARVGIGKPLDTLPMSPQDLCWGIEQLLENSVEARIPENATGWVGAVDPLLDAARLAALERRIRIVANVGHELDLLLEAGKER